MQTLILTTDNIRHIVQKVGLNTLMDDLIVRLREALAAYKPDNYVSPARAGFNYSTPHTGLIEWMPIMSSGNQATIKVVGYHPHNPQIHHLPTILSTTSIYDVSSGHLLALADSTFLTAMRTGAASAIASQYLAKPVNGTVGLIGAGSQAVTQLHALSRLFPVERVLVYDVDPETSASFAERVGFLGITIEDVSHSQLNWLVQTVDILCTATSVPVGEGPVFDDVDCRPWLHVNAVGSDFPGKTEVPQSLLRRGVVCPDFLPQALQEGECQQLDPAEVGPSLVEVVQRPSAYHHLADTITVFDSTGWALEDQVALDMMLAYAADLGIGYHLQIEDTAADPKDPFLFLKDKAAITSSIPFHSTHKS
jgi:ornithine cyclodeaminase/alanine dehydrogenase-like protein (mu-crystallin family)